MIGGAQVCSVRWASTYHIADLPGASASVDIAGIGVESGVDLLSCAQARPLLTLVEAATEVGASIATGTSEGSGGEERHRGQDGVEVELHLEWCVFLVIGWV